MTRSSSRRAASSVVWRHALAVTAFACALAATDARAVELTVSKSSDGRLSHSAKPIGDAGFSFPDHSFLTSAMATGTRRMHGPRKPEPAAFDVRMTGMIVTGDAGRIRGVLNSLTADRSARGDTSPVRMELSSLGGSLTDGLEIGATLRQYGVTAIVRARDICLSSCALALLGGTARGAVPAGTHRCNLEIGSKVAFHNFFLNPAGLREATASDPVASRLQGFADARKGAASLVKYAAEAGVAPEFIANLMGRPVDDFQYVETVGQFIDLHLCPIGLGRPSISLEEQAANVCNNSTGTTSSEVRNVVRRIEPFRAKRHLLEQLQASLQSANSKGRLAALLADGAVMRVDAEVERLYEDLRAAGAALPQIAGPTFEVSRTGADGPMSCYVSLSTTRPDDFDVVVARARGFAAPPHSPPTDARRLFLFDRNTVVNPRS